MTPKQAKAVITTMKHWKIDDVQICGGSPYVNCNINYVDDLGATLDGDFTSDQLEAIATWMRNPKGVAEA